MRALIITLCIALIWIALGLACALRVACRRRTGDSQVAGDPFFFPFGEMPIVPFIGERCEPFPITNNQFERLTSAVVPRRNESDGRRESCPVSSLSSGQGAAVVLTFPLKNGVA